jgi:polyhydroxybutyrate depolymerase
MLSFITPFGLSLVMVLVGSGLHQFALAELGLRNWTVEGVPREALVYVPSQAKSTKAPLVFAFHGHGGSMRFASRSFRYHEHWPEALVVYMQGLNTPGKLTDPEGKKPGWQAGVGDQWDRDLKFFDTVLQSLKQDFQVDEQRLYATGHSNGGGFTYLLWATRGDLFAAFAPSAALAKRASTAGILPKPALHIAGTKDPLVQFAWQEKMIEAVKKLNGCQPQGQAWKNSGSLEGTLYPSSTGTPLITLLHPGGHQFLPEAPPLVVEFFKEHVKPVAAR